MPNPLIIDCHLHLYESQDQALWGKDSYEIWEYGDKAEVHASRFAGDVGDALNALSEAGAAKAVAVNLFGVSRAREQAIAELPEGLTPTEERRETERIDESMGDSIKLTVIATGFNQSLEARPQEVSRLEVETVPAQQETPLEIPEPIPSPDQIERQFLRPKVGCELGGLTGDSGDQAVGTFGCHVRVRNYERLRRALDIEAPFYRSEFGRFGREQLRKNLA